MFFIYELDSENWIGNSKLDNKIVFSHSTSSLWQAWAEGNEIRET